MSMWYSADENVTKCHIGGEGAKLIHHKRYNMFRENLIIFCVDVVEW